jgi:hypothetical protein
VKKWSTVWQYTSYPYITRNPMIPWGGTYCTVFTWSLGYPLYNSGWLIYV